MRSIGLIHLLLLFCGALPVWGATPVGPIPQQHDIATEICRYTFEKENDLDYDQQPDDWSRRLGTDFPNYVTSLIDRKVGFQSPQSLRFDLNGARAVYYSSPVRVDTEHSYFLKARIKTDQMHHNSAMVSLSFLNGKRQRMQRWMTPPVTGTGDWQEVTLGPLQPGDDVQYLLVGCHIVTGERLDVRGHAWFDDIWLGKAPRLSIRTNRGSHLFMQGDTEMTIETKVQGVESISSNGDANNGEVQRKKLVVELQDDRGGRLKSQEFPLENLERIPTGSPKPYIWNLANDPDVMKVLQERRLRTFSAAARLEHNNRSVLLATTAFAILDQPSQLSAREFGWSFPRGLPEIPPGEFATLATEAGLGWIKIPLWSALNEEQQRDKSKVGERPQPGSGLATQIVELEKRRITTVGLLNDPPLKLRKLVDDSSGISSLFQLPVSDWYPTLEPVLARYSFLVRYWQLGDDREKSFVGMKRVGATLTRIKAEFDRIGRDVLLGVHWPANAKIRLEEFSSHQFLSVGDSERYSHKSLGMGLTALRGSNLGGWASIDLPPTGETSREERLANLAKQVIVAKLSQAQTIILNDPASKSCGVLNPDGTPADLFIPWRILTQTLTGAKYAQRMNFRNGSTNVAFEKNGATMLVVWRDQPLNAPPVEERGYLGESIEILDLWGEVRKPDTDPDTREQIFLVGAIPIFIMKCSEPILRWQTAVKYERGKISSEYGSHKEAILGTNSFSQGVSGVVRIHMPRDWKVEPREWPLQLAVGEKFQLPMAITFPAQGCQGKLESRLEFDIVADRQYRFNMVLPYEIGLGDVTLAATQRYLPEGRLEIKQTIVNNTTEQMSFRCILIVPGEKRQQQEVVKLGRSEDQKLYFVGRDVAQRLVGQELFLRAEQVPGRRVLNFKWKVEPPPEKIEAQPKPKMPE